MESNKHVDSLEEKLVKETAEAFMSGEMPELHFWPHKDEPEYTTKSFSSFSGADLVISLDGKIIGEMSALTWEEDFFPEDEYAIKGEMEFVLFDSELSVYELAQSKKKFTTVMTYLNEFGQSLYYRIYDCLLTKRSGIHGIDEFIITEKYQFKAKKIEKLSEAEFKEQVVMY